MGIIPGAVFIERSFMPDPAMVSLVTTSLWMFVVYLKTGRSIFLIFYLITGMLGFLTKIPGLIIGLPMLYCLYVFKFKENI